MAADVVTIACTICGRDLVEFDGGKLPAIVTALLPQTVKNANARCVGECHPKKRQR